MRSALLVFFVVGLAMVGVAAAEGLQAPEIVLDARNVVAMAGDVQIVPDPEASIGEAIYLGCPIGNVGGIRADPKTWFEMEFYADADVPYYIWVRGVSRTGDRWTDAVWIQFNEDIGTDQGAKYNPAGGFGGYMEFTDLWGKGDFYAWAFSGKSYTFKEAGIQRMRVFLRQGPHYIDQIWLSTSLSMYPVDPFAVRELIKSQEEAEEIFFTDPMPPAQLITVKVPTPEARPGPGQWRELPDSVTLFTGVKGATIYYTLDGTTPTRDSLKYTQPIPLVKGQTNIIKAIAIRDVLPGSFAKYTDSDVATFVYEPNPDLVMLTDVLQPGLSYKEVQDIIDKVIAEMTLEEKAKWLWGHGGCERLGLVNLSWTDGPTGVKGKGATAWPNPMARASTWNVELMELIGKAFGKDARYYNKNCIGAGAINIHRDPLGGRVFEYYSEDPFLTGKMVAGFIRGCQNQGVGICVKHYVANDAENNRTGIDVNVSERALREIYLVPFEIAIKEASPWDVMTSYNKVNGVWASGNEYTLSALREFGFSGFVSPDGNAFVPVAAWAYGHDRGGGGGKTGWVNIIEAVEKGVLDESDLDRALTNCLNVNIRALKDRVVITFPELKAEDKLLAIECLAEGIVLLKNNEHALPFDRKVLNIGLFGSVAIPEIGWLTKGLIIQGDGSARVPVNYDDVVSMRQAFEEAGFEVLQKNAAGEWLQEGLTKEDALYAAKNSDVAVILIGRHGQEGCDNPPESMYLTDDERDMIDKVSEAYHELGKKVVVLLNVAHPMVVDFDKYVDGLLYIGLPGTYGAHAVVDVLTGEVNPSGKLVDTWPCDYSLAPTYGNMPAMGQPSITYTEDINVGYRYYDSHPEAVKYPFGYGLSYSTFTFKNLQLSKNVFDLTNPNEVLAATVEVWNTGNVAGKEVAQLYVKPPKSSKIERPVKELKGFAKTVLLPPGEHQRLTFLLTARDFAYWDETTHSWVVEPGKYTIIVGGTSDEAVLAETGLSAVVEIVK